MTSPKDPKPGPQPFPRVRRTALRPGLTEVTTDDGMFIETFKELDPAYLEAEGVTWRIGPAPPPWGDPKEEVPKIIAALRARFSAFLAEDAEHPKSQFPGTEMDRPRWRGEAETMLGALTLWERALARRDLYSAAFFGYCVGKHLCCWNHRALVLEDMRKRRRSREGLVPRSESAAWRAVRLADKPTRRKSAKELESIYMSRLRETDPQRYQAICDMPQDRAQANFASQLSRRRKTWRTGKN